MLVGGDNISMGTYRDCIYGVAFAAQTALVYRQLTLCANSAMLRQLTNERADPSDALRTQAPRTKCVLNSTPART
jgi:hypothetical protein